MSSAAGGAGAGAAAGSGGFAAPFQAISASSVSKASPTRGQLLDSAFNEQLELAHELIRAAVETTDEFEAVVGAFRERYGTPKDVAEESRKCVRLVELVSSVQKQIHLLVFRIHTTCRSPSQWCT